MKGQSRSVICIPSIKEECDNKLIMTEFNGELIRGKTPHVIVEIRDPTGVEKVIKKGIVVGEVYSVGAAIPIRLLDTKTDNQEIEKVDINHITVGTEKDLWMPNADLSHLEISQRRLIKFL